jgi:5-methylcytosine-specific restriction protein A
MLMRPCLDCGRPIPGTHKRCALHAKPGNRRGATTTERGYGAAHQRRARAVIAAHPWCQECGTTENLTADHVTPIANGGDPLGDLQVLCRSCNSTRGNTRGEGVPSRRETAPR